MMLSEFITTAPGSYLVLLLVTNSDKSDASLFMNLEGNFFI